MISQRYVVNCLKPNISVIYFQKKENSILQSSLPFFSSISYFLNKDKIHKNTIAPTVAVIKLPRIPLDPMPSNPNNQPPKRPPTIPTSRLTSTPNPPPLHDFTSQITSYNSDNNRPQKSHFQLVLQG